MNRYFNTMIGRRKIDGEYVFSFDAIIANGIAFAIGYVPMFFAAPKIPGLKKICGGE